VDSVDFSVEAEVEKAWARKFEALNTQHQADAAASDAQLKALQKQLQRYVDSRSLRVGVYRRYTYHGM
jgi:hypothetical protein